MLKKNLLHGLVSGVLAFIACLVYEQIYRKSLGVDFTKIVRVQGIAVFCLVGTLLASTGYWLVTRWLGTKSEGVFNLFFALLSFASIVGPFAFKLPLDYESPELFPGLTVPMHFFPVVAWLAIQPFFRKKHV